MGDRSVYKSVGQEEDTTDIAKRVAQITVSAIKQMPLLASQVEGCVSLGQGIPSFATPLFIREAVIEGLRKNETIGKYSLQPGVPELKIEIAKRLQRTKGIPVNPETDVFVSCGAMEALAVSNTSSPRSMMVAIPAARASIAPQLTNTSVSGLTGIPFVC